MRSDVFQDLCNANDDFAAIARKWRNKALKSARKISKILEMPYDDALQEVLVCMWQAYQSYCKHQVRYLGKIWDVVVDGPKYKLRYPSTGELLTVQRWRVEPIDKCLAASSYVYMRLVQWQANMFTMHFRLKNGYAHSPEKVVIKGKTVPSFVKVVFSDSLDEPDTDENSYKLYSLREALVSRASSPESDVAFIDEMKYVWNNLDPLAQQALELFLIESHGGGAGGAGAALIDFSYVADTIGVSVPEAKTVLYDMFREFPKTLKNYEAVRHNDDGVIRRTKPVHAALVTL